MSDTIGEWMRAARPRDGGMEREVLLQSVQHALFRVEPTLSLGRYTSLRVLGNGGVGVVYSAFDPLLERRVALKVLRTHKGLEPERLLHEARSMARLSHANVVTVHEVGWAEDRAFIAMELVHGPNLQTWLGTHPSVKEILGVFVQAGEGLAAGHSAGIVHRDFKPSNVFIGANGDVKVGDFGLARIFEDDTGANDPRMTLGNGAGTPAYLAPERYAGGPATPAGDQFSFCVALYEALYQAHPFGPTASAQARIARGERAPVTTWRGPKSVRTAIDRGLSRLPGERFATMDPLLRILRQAIAPRSSMRYWGPALACLGIAATVAAGTSRQDTCGPKSPSIWTAEQSTRVEESFLNTSLPYAATSFQTVDRLFTDQNRMLDEGEIQACELARRTPQAPVLPAIEACLKRQRRQLSFLALSLEHADPALVRQATSVVQTFPSAGQCFAQSQGQESILVDGPAAAELDAAWTSFRVANLVEAQQHANATLRLASTPPAALLDADLVLALVASRQGDPKGAEALEDVYFRARQAHNDASALSAALELASGGKLGQPTDDQLRWLRHAEVLAPDDATAGSTSRLLVQRGSLLNQAGRYDQAWPVLEAALTELTPLGLHRDLEAAVHYELATCAYWQDRTNEALEHIHKAEAAGISWWGDSHPEVGKALELEGLIMSKQGDHASALVLAHRVRAIREQTLGPDHPTLGVSDNNMASLLLALGRFDEAQKLVDSAATILAKAHGEDGAALSHVWALRAGIAFAQGDDAQVTAAYDRATEIAHATYGDDHPHTIALQIHRAEQFVRRRDPASALEILDRLDPILPDQSAGIRAHSEFVRGFAHIEMAAPQRALAPLQRSLAIDPEDSPEPHFQLARAEQLLGHDREAAAHIEDALQHIPKPPGSQVRLKQEIERWLEAR